MKSAIRWMAQNHVAANLLMLVFVVGGLLMAPKVRRRSFPGLPRLDFGLRPLSGGRPGGGRGRHYPEDRGDLTGVDGIEQIKSTAAEGAAR